MNTAATFSNWEANLSLAFERSNDNNNEIPSRTVLARRRHKGPLVVQRPFYPEGDTCHVYLLHPPGGIAGGDHLDIDITSHPHAHCLLTTPAANKFYCSDGPAAVQQQSLIIKARSTLEWLPQETILFNGGKVHSHTRIEMEPGARFIGWEILCLGRPASDERFEQGFCRQHIELWRNTTGNSPTTTHSQPMLIERALFEGGSDVLAEPWGLAGMPVTGTMIITPATKTELALVRENVQAKTPERFSATLINDALVLRYLGTQGEHARQCFTRAWQTVRPSLMNKPACIPRIWKT